ncbi:MAG: hypothetical protein U0736_21360 [Gemmataceae bacterium]
MTCRTCLDLLHRHLDGDVPAGVLFDHLDRCPAAASTRDGIDRLLAGVALLQPPPPPAGLADRITADLLAEANRPVRLRFPAAAAERGRPRRGGVPLLALGAAAGLAWRSAADRRSAPTVAGNRAADPPLPPLRDTVSQGATAVAALTSRTAVRTVEGTAALLPPVPDVPLDPLPMAPADMDPTREPLQEVGEGLKAGLSPVTESARRAVTLFFRELPLSRSPAANKPG